jgi:ADP-ribose pyrophosphatase YjhB (NUDIX family)
MASLSPGNSIVIALHVGGSKALDIKLVLQQEPRSGKTWFPADTIFPNEAHVDKAVRELFEETRVTRTVDDLTRLSGKWQACSSTVTR